MAPPSPPLSPPVSPSTLRLPVFSSDSAYTPPRPHPLRDLLPVGPVATSPLRRIAQKPALHQHPRHLQTLSNTYRAASTPVFHPSFFVTAHSIKYEPRATKSNLVAVSTTCPSRSIPRFLDGSPRGSVPRLHPPSRSDSAAMLNGC